MGNTRIIDITLPLKEPMRGFSKSVSKSIDTDGWNATDLHIYSHAGTHMDAPLHFDVNPSTIDKIAPERFICNCHIIRIPDVKPKQLLDLSCLGETANKIQKDEAVILHTGWSKYVSKPELYRDKLPRIGKNLAEWFAEHQVNIVGVEPPSIADVNNLDELQMIHRIMLEADILILEGLTNLENIHQDYVKLMAFPLKISGGDGAPVRAIIIEEN